MRKLYLLLLRFFCWSIISLAQAGSNFAQSPVYQHYTTANGLPSSEVYHAFQDSKGYIWFATNNGVSRFDGYTFKNFGYEEGLPDNTVFEIFEDYKGRIWFSTYSCRFSYFENDSIHAYKYNKALAAFFKRLPCPAKGGIYIDKNDNFYLSDLFNGIFCITSKGEVKKYHYKCSSLINIIDGKPLFTASGDWGNNILKIVEKDITLFSFNFTGYHKKMTMPLCEKRGNTVYLSVENHLGIVKNYKELIKKEMESTLLWMKFDRSNRLWISPAAKGALYYENGDINRPSAIRYLPNKSVTSVFEDNEHGIWFTTSDEGVYYLPSLNILSYTDADGLPNNLVGAIATSGNILWAGIAEGNIIKICNHTITNIKIPGERLFYSIASINYNSDIYFGGSESGGKISGEHIEFFKNEHPSTKLFPNPKISCKNILPFGNNGVWFGYYNSLSYAENGYVKYLSHFDDSIELRIDALCYDNDSNLWIGSHKGLWKYEIPKQNGSKGKYTYYGNYDEKLKTRILDLKYGHNNDLWIGTKGAGIIIYKNKKVYQLTTRDGLTSNTINILLIDGNRVWAGTSNGLNKITCSGFNNNRFIIEKITTTNGLVSNEINDLAISGTTIYTATPEGISFFDFNKIGPNTMAPKVVIQGIKINFRDTLVQKKYILDYTQNNVQINFSGLMYRNAGKSLYKYKMTGGEYTYTGNPVVQYPALSPGQYSFEVYACNEDGYWSHEPQYVFFEIKSPFYKTWWFITLVFAAFTFGIWLFFRLRYIRIREKNKLLDNLHQYMLKALGQQMNPHFIFNSLNSIQYYILQNDKVNSSSFLEKFASLMRLILENSQEELIPIREEIKAVNIYLELEQMRFKDKFDFEIRIKEDDILENKITPLLLQPFVENSIIHGFSSKNDKGILTITVEKNDNGILCVIEDNGIGREASAAQKARKTIKSRSLGTKITSTRINIINSLYKTSMEVNYIDLKTLEGKACGTRVEILLPELT